ncbi:MAG TPA: hypothetical protein VEA99_05080, partial [Gemmatimonadaceae bacterium]|nr:hypothetical protein [Gemmatimonadaceae bacterium]
AAARAQEAAVYTAQLSVPGTGFGIRSDEQFDWDFDEDGSGLRFAADFAGKKAALARKYSWISDPMERDRRVRSELEAVATDGGAPFVQNIETDDSPVGTVEGARDLWAECEYPGGVVEIHPANIQKCPAFPRGQEPATQGDDEPTNTTEPAWDPQLEQQIHEMAMYVTDETRAKSQFLTELHRRLEREKYEPTLADIASRREYDEDVEPPEDNSFFSWLMRGRASVQETFEDTGKQVALGMLPSTRNNEVDLEHARQMHGNAVYFGAAAGAAVFSEVEAQILGWLGQGAIRYVGDVAEYFGRRVAAKLSKWTDEFVEGAARSLFNRVDNFVVEHLGGSRIRWLHQGGGGIRLQGAPWEDYLEKAVLQDANRFSKPNFKAFDFLRGSEGISAKTLDTLTPYRVQDARRIFWRIRKHVNDMVEFTGDIDPLVGVVEPSRIESRTLMLAVPRATTREGWQQIGRGMAYAAEQGVKVVVTAID